MSTTSTVAPDLPEPNWANIEPYSGVRRSITAKSAAPSRDVLPDTFIAPDPNSLVVCTTTSGSIHRGRQYLADQIEIRFVILRGDNRQVRVSRMKTRKRIDLEQLRSVIRIHAHINT